jgi:hypothetical protein
MFFFSFVQGLVEHIFFDILWDYGWILYEKKNKKMMFDEKMGKVFKGERKEKKRKEKKRKVFHCVFKILC